MTGNPHRFGTDDSNPSLIRWPEERPAYTSLRAAAQGETARWNAVGMATAIVHGDEAETVVTGAASIETGFPVTENALFLIGSISKVYTATLVMRLCEIGLLDLDTPVITYIPELELASASAREQMTLRHLLSHSSGIEGDRFIDYGRGDDALAKAIGEFGTLAQWFRPGSFYSYCNAGFYLTGRIIEKVTGKPFEQVMTEELRDPLGLEHTFILPEYALGHPFATGHEVDRREGVSVAESQSLPRCVAAAGGIMSSIGDLMRFARLHLGNGEIDGVRIISEESALAMREAFIEADTFDRSYGVGWSIQAYSGSDRGRPRRSVGRAPGAPYDHPGEALRDRRAGQLGCWCPRLRRGRGVGVGALCRHHHAEARADHHGQGCAGPLHGHLHAP